MDGGHGWAQANTDARHNPELHEPGGAYRQLKQRVLGSVTALASSCSSSSRWWRWLTEHPQWCAG